MLELPAEESPPTSINRRGFLGLAAAAAGVAAAGAGAGEEARESSQAAPAQRPFPPDGGIVDVNVSLSRWPLRRLTCDETPALAGKLRAQGVEQAWAGSFDALLHKDLGAVNTRLAEDCRRDGAGLLVPFGTVNPKLPDWEEELRRCAEVHKMPGIRLHPNYHGYKCDDPDFARLLALATERDLVVQIVTHMEDERMMHPLLRVEPVDGAALAEAIGRVAGARVVLLNALNLYIAETLTRLLASGEIYVEIATLEGVGGVARLLGQAPLSRVMFGSHAPLFYFESAALKLRESPLTDEQLGAIRRGNARRLLNSKGATP